ncbi:hypothetical protein ACFOSV_04425 [Algoriphagus namhaensis]|uniref:Uncharacterized protein n=1 Tax=Algoriphagus namhaensis TaxID=915353 RepID=A0ABV8AMZ3_9BACT
MNRMILGLLVCLLLAQFSFSQDTRSYKGGYTFKELRGTAELNYTLDEELEPILNGPFSFAYSKMDSLRPGLFTKLKANGAYLTNLKDGPWTYRLEEHQIAIQDITNQEIEAALTSHIVSLKSGYQTGKLSGDWVYSEESRNGGEPSLLFKTEDLSFQGDSLIGPVKFIAQVPGKNYQISGRVDQEGLMTGNWEFIYPIDSNLNIRETRRYEKGFLIGLSKLNRLTGEIIDEVVFYKAIEKLDSLNRGLEVDYQVSDQAFGLIFNDGYTETSDEFREQYLGTFLLEDALGRVLQFEEEFVDETGKLKKYPLSTRRFVYPISDNDQERYNRILAIYDELKSESEQKAIQDFLDLNQNTSDSLAFSEAYFEYLNEKLDNYQRLIELFRNGDIRYFDQENYMKDGLNFLNSTETISYYFQLDPKEKVLQFPELAEKKNLGIDLLAHMEREYEIFLKIQSFIKNQQVNFRQTSRLDVLESRILSERERVKELKESLPIRNERHKALMDSVYQNLSSANYQALLNEYNSNSVFLQKAEIGDEILDLFLFLDETLPELEGYENLASSLRKEFTEKTLDPFTFESDFEVLRQPGLIEATEVILEYDLGKIMSSEDFREVQVLLLNLDALESRMLELKGKNTRRLERNLKKVMSEVSQLKKILSI